MCPHYNCINPEAEEVEVSLKTKTRCAIQHLAIDATDLEIYGEGEWMVKKYGTDGGKESGVSCISRYIQAPMK